MTRVPRLLITTAMLGAAAACSTDQITLGEGQSSSLNVRVYVDADGSGKYESGEDVAIQGATVTASGDDGDVTAMTDADGLATLQLSPGSYTLSLTATVPGGAVLATATNPTVVASFQGGTIAAEFRYSNLPGVLSGVIFRDDNANGSYDPGDDGIAEGVELTLLAGAPPGGDTVATTITAADGTFSFAGLRPGSYTLEVTPLGTMQVVGGTTIAVTVQADVPTSLPVEFTGNLIITIAEARASAEGTVIAIEGVITWQAQWDASIYFLQDATGGISAFDGSDPALQIGDSVRVVGARGSFRSEVQISPSSAPQVLGNVGEPAIRPVNATYINAGLFQGELVTITGTVDSLNVDGFDNQTVFLTDEEGVTFNVFGDARNGMASTDWTVSQTVDIVGVLGTDDRNTPAARLETRSIDDVTMPITIGAARGMTGDTVIVEGVVTWQQQWDSRVYFFQDATGGISVFDSDIQPTLRRGDRVRMRGEVSVFRGETQLSPVVNAQRIGQDVVPTARAVTAAEINAGQFQGELVAIAGTVDSLQVDGFDNQTVFLTDGAATTFTVYGDSRNGVGSAAWTVGQMVQVTGVLGSDDRNTLQYRVEIRDAADMVLTGDAAISIATARGLVGDTVFIEGVVTWQQQWDSRVYFFQDATGGISTFDSDVQPTLQRGDRIRVRGEVSVFRGETQASPVITVSILGQEAVPDPRTVTAAEINGSQFQGQLVKITGTVDSLQVFTFDNHMVFMTDDAAETFTVFVDSRNGVASTDWTTGVTVRVVGVLGTDDRNTPQPRIELRDAADRLEIP